MQPKRQDGTTRDRISDSWDIPSGPPGSRSVMETSTRDAKCYFLWAILLLGGSSFLLVLIIITSLASLSGTYRGCIRTMTVPQCLAYLSQFSSAIPSTMRERRQFKKVKKGLTKIITLIRTNRSVEGTLRGFPGRVRTTRKSVSDVETATSHAAHSGSAAVRNGLNRRRRDASQTNVAIAG